MQFFNLFKKQLKSNPITIILFIIIFYISSLGLSILVSTISKFSNEVSEYQESFDEYTVEGTLMYDDNYNNNNIIKALSKIPDDIKFRTSFESFKINNIDDRKVVISEYFKNPQNTTYPIQSGRFYTAKEIQNGEKVVLVGKNISEKYLNGKNTISIDNEIYKVLGVVGYKNKESTFDENIFMPITSLSKMTLNGFESYFFRNIFLSGKSEFPVDEIYNLEKSLNKISPNDNISLGGVEKVDRNISGVSDGIMVYSGEIIIIVISMLFAVLNMILINYFWIKDRRFEIGIRKAFGISNYNIALLLLFEFLSIVIFSSILAILSHIALSFFLENIKNYYLGFNIYNFLIIIAFNVLISIIVSAIPIIKAIKISPIEIVKGE